jgi:hypothetical protein
MPDNDGAAVLEAFRVALNARDIEACVALLDEAAVLDIGSGRFEGRRQITSLLRALLRVHYVATAEPAPKSDGIVTALWAVAHDDLRRLGLERLEMLVEAEVRGGALVLLCMRAKPETLTRLKTLHSGQEQDQDGASVE